MGYKPTPTSAAARAHVASARAAPPPERERARAVGAVRTCARSQVSCSCGARGLHAGARPCTEGGGRPAGAVGFHRVKADSNQRGGARARRKRACCASSRERASARGWRSSDLRTLASQLLVWSTRLARRSTAVHRGGWPSRRRSRLPWSMSRLQPARRGARTSHARVLGLLPRESERARLAQFGLAHARKSAARVEHAACTPKHGRAPRGAAVPPAQ